MEMTIFLTIIAFLTLMQSAMPYFSKQTITFGVTIPESHTDDARLSTFKRTYSALVLITGVLACVIFVWLSSIMSEQNFILAGLALQFIVLGSSMILYFFFHLKVMALKKKEAWGNQLKQVTVTDLSLRSQDEMLPTFLFALPMVITLGLLAYTAVHYPNLPDQIPTHWGPNGKPDAFSDKSPFSAIAMLVILLIMQAMFGLIHWSTKSAGIRLRAAKKQASKIQQLTFRKYSSWLLFFVSILVTVLLGYLQMANIHDQLGNSTVLFILPISFVILILAATAFYAFKIGQGGARIEIDIVEESKDGLTDIDDDVHWKAGIFYVNRNDPSLFVEKRFGVGWTINFGQPLSYFIIFVPLVLIIGISLFL